MATLRSRAYRLAAAVALCAVITLSLLLFMARFLVVEDKLSRSDLIVVLSGAPRRIDYAIDLYNKGLAEKLFFTSCSCLSSEDNPGLNSATRSGIPPESIIVDYVEVYSTYDEAVILRDYIRRSGEHINNIMIVSDPYHMRRAQWIFWKVLGSNVRLQMAPVPFDYGSFQQNQLAWDLRYLRMIFLEYIKIPYYILRYGIG